MSIGSQTREEQPEAEQFELPPGMVALGKCVRCLRPLGWNAGQVHPAVRVGGSLERYVCEICARHPRDYWR